MHSLKAITVCLNPMVSMEAPIGSASPGRRFSKKNHGRAQRTEKTFRQEDSGKASKDSNLRHTPPENAIRTLNALVLFSVLSSDFRPFKMPTMTARMMISPAEQTANEMLDILFLSIDSYSACS